MSDPLLEVNNLSISFTQYTAGLRQKQLHIIRDLNVTIYPGEIVAIVGSSGSGKSLLAHAVIGITPRNATVSGTMLYAGEPLTPKRQAALRGREIALVPQSVNSLDPLMRVGAQVRYSARNSDLASAKRLQNEMFSRYQLIPEHGRLYPFQLSGGMARRVLMATALVSEARFIIADEPTPGLHPEVVHEALGHFRQLADEGRAVMLITHDIETALAVADRIAVFYAGTTIEVASAKDFNSDGHALRHPYSRALWQALPQNQFVPIPGFQPSPEQQLPGCLFEPRCASATAECTAAQPEMRHVRGGMVRCYHAT